MVGITRKRGRSRSRRRTGRSVKRVSSRCRNNRSVRRRGRRGRRTQPVNKRRRKRSLVGGSDSSSSDENSLGEAEAEGQALADQYMKNYYYQVRIGVFDSPTELGTSTLFNDRSLSEHLSYRIKVMVTLVHEDYYRKGDIEYFFRGREADNNFKFWEIRDHMLSRHRRNEEDLNEDICNFYIFHI